MKVLTKYIFLSVAMLGVVPLAKAQKDTTASKETGEIVMTQEELESFLSKIAIRKKQQIENKKKAARSQQLLDATTFSAPSPIALQSQGSGQHELRLINDKLDFLLSAQQNPGQVYTGSTIDRAALSGMTANERNFYNARITELQNQVNELNRRSGIAVSPVVTMVPQNLTATDPALPPVTDANATASLRLQRQIDSLQIAVNHMSQLARTESHDTNVESVLQEKVKTLTEELQQLRSQQTAAQNLASTTNTALAGYRHTIYFANNSAVVSNSDMAELREFASKLSTSGMKATVILQGFSSTTGNAAYNNKLSEKRANAVREILQQFGIQPGDLTISFHGADGSRNEQLARRVELSVSMR